MCGWMSIVDAQGALQAVTNDLKRDVRVDVDPKVSRERALEIVALDLKRAARPDAALTVTTELVIFPATRRIASGSGAQINATDARESPAEFHLAWHVRTRVESDEGVAHHSYLIDAHSGVTLEHWDDLHTAASLGVAQSQYSGTVGLNTNSAAGGFELRDMTRGVNGKFGNNVVTNLDHATSGVGTAYTSADNHWGDGADYVSGAATTSPNGQTAAVDAAFGIQATWDYFRNVHQRDGIDDKGTATYARGHFGNGYSNAFWDDSCFCMTFGDGKAGATMATPPSLNTVAHELAHGVTTSTANLVYMGESGGLNEAASDIYSTMVEFYVRGAGAVGAIVPETGGNWTFGEQDAPNLMRYMQKPSLDG